MTFFALAAKYREYIAKCVLHSYPKFFMRISLLLFFSTTILSNLLAATLVSAQQIDKVQVSIELKNETLTDAIHKIEKQTSFTFLYRNEDVANVRSLNLKNSKITLSSLLTKLLTGTALTYKQVDQRIIIDKAPPKQQTNTESYDENFYAKQLTDSTFLLKGRVTDEKTGMPMVGAGISSADKQSVTDADGSFKIPVTVGNKLIVSYMGFQTIEILIENSTTNNLEIKMDKGSKKAIQLAEVNIEWDKVKANPTKFVNLENRQYMNLSQILQGTIPGLSLQIVSTSTKTITSIDAFVYRLYGLPYGQFKRFTVDEFLNYFGRTQGQNIIDQLLKGSNVPKSISDFYHINTTITISSALVPEIRGANNFGGANISNMLVVIDGFPQDGFPANYPMTNVESIEVIKDPKELIKWGPRAAGGAIIIKSKAAKAGNLQFNYTASFYYAKAAKFNRERLRLADSRTYLNYLKDVDSVGGTSYGVTEFGLTPAKQLLSQRKRNVITTEQFNAQWDSLARLNNDAQLNLLQQNLFNQTHSLTVSGGSQAYKFTAIGNYTDGQTNDLNSKNTSYGFSLNNSFNLLKDKLHIRWLINYSDTKSRTGYSFSPTNTGIEPYQMLLDGQGNYVYDNTALSAAGNQLIQSRGYKNYGVNVLEDARLNKNTSNTINRQSNFNMNWNLLPGVNWVSSIIYSHRNTDNDQLYNAESSYARQFVDTYGQLTSNGVNFYVPYGNIYKPGRSVNDDWNVRSALTYSKVFGKHAVNVGVGAGAASLTVSSPAYNTLYGYNATTKTSTPIYLPTTPSTQATINNFYALFPNSASNAYPSSLTQKNMGDTAIVRNVNTNASVDYSYADRIKVSGLYTQAYSPLYGQAAAYSTQSSYNGDVTGSVLKNGGKFVKDVLLSVGLQGIKMPDLPAQYSNTRYLQT
ncbi:carboxypeptidase-like regulatory domain-containing protein, partial [Mucilaginibacter sp.]|uniref:carboxypeptidase-like regulatory domain-containing protein n=1 Tax=Mucilaginibacter sp. TaxID=1882438 RepID=UPI002ED05207